MLTFRPTRVLAVSFFLACFAAASFGEQQNLVQNPGFEEGGQNPNGWQRIFVSNLAQGLTFETDSKEPFAGKVSVSIGTTNEKNTLFNSWTQTFQGKALESFPRETPLLLSAAMRTEKTANVNVWLQYFDTKENQLKLFMISPLRPVIGTTAWATYCERVFVPKKTTTFLVRCGLWGNGTAWFDDVSLEILKE